jgi:predicted metal-binding protein
MYSLLHVTAAIKLADYLKDYRDAARFIEYCKVCNRYKACWSCPPFEFDTEEYLSPYETAYIVGTKIVLDENTIRENSGWDACRKTAYAILEEVRPGLDGKLLELEKRYPASKAFFAGTCHVCPAGGCARIEGRPCIAPNRIRPALESFGFDIGKTSEDLLHVELKWSRDGILPEYLTLVSGFFTQGTIPGFSLV